MLDVRDHRRTSVFVQRFRQWLRQNHRRQVNPNQPDASMEKYAPSTKTQLLQDGNRFVVACNSRCTPVELILVKTGWLTHRSRSTTTGRRSFPWPCSTIIRCSLAAALFFYFKSVFSSFGSSSIICVTLAIFSIPLYKLERVRDKLSLRSSHRRSSLLLLLFRLSGTRSDCS